MKKILFCIFVGSSTFFSAQDFLGLHNDNYAGALSALSNPANIADSRLKFDLYLVGGSTHFDNNYYYVDRNKLIDSKFKIDKSDLNIYTSDYSKAAYVANRLVMPSFMFNFGKKNAIALNTSIRNYANVAGISQDLANAAYYDFSDPSVFLKNIESEDVISNQMVWAEYGLTYARVLKDDNEHFFKAGASVKLLQGLGASYFSLENLNMQIDTTNIYSFLAADVSYGYSENFDLSDPDNPKYNHNPSYGFGFDIGGVYEWRPKYFDFKHDMDGEKDLWRRDQNKYKLKASVAINDIGGVKFNKGVYSNDFSPYLTVWNLDTFDINGIAQFDSLVDTKFPSTSTSNSFKMSLPTSINLQFDYYVGGSFYLNFTTNWANPLKNRNFHLNEYTKVSIAPRIEFPWFGMGIPISYNSLAAQHSKNLMMGLMLRLGPVIIGTNDLLNYFSKNIYGASAYVLFRVPIPYKLKSDKDRDRISDKKDKCADVAGVWEFKGCPDKDGDHVQDSEDLCPNVAGLKKFQGCPDRDGDQITDAKDMCPDTFGLAEFKGCPDSDGDKIIDRLDECPFDVGLAEFKGCPDKDADGTPDKKDPCPEVFGPRELKGCPDKDGDGIIDKDDACPQQSGPLENKGCPWPDTDNDGVLDKDDACPQVAGIIELKGCPASKPSDQDVPMKAAEKKIIEKAFATLEFASGKDLIKAKSLPALTDLAKLLVAHTEDWKLKLSGHTDNQGKAEINMLLSEKRTMAVKNYLLKKGVRDEQVLTEWHGSEIPIEDNATPKGRQKNRRVEMKILLKE